MNWRGKILAFCFALAMIAAACGDGSTAGDATAEADGVAADSETETADSSDSSEGTEDSEAATDTTEAPATTATTATTAEETTTSMAAPAIEEAMVTVLDAGAEPRSELRLDIADGTTQTMVMNQRQTLVQELGGEPIQDLEISIVTKQELVTNVIDGGYRVTGTVTSSEAGPDADPATAAQVTASLQAMVGVVTESEIDDRGNLITSQVDGTGGLDATTQEMMQSAAQLSVPLPDEAVGVGARWEITQPLLLAGVPTVQTSRYTLAAIDGSVVTLETESSQTVESGSTFEQGGVEIEVVSWTNNGTGTILIDLDLPVPTSTAISSAVQELLIPGSADPLKQTIDVAIEISAE